MRIKESKLRRIIRNYIVENYDGLGRPNWDNEEKLRKAGKFKGMGNISKSDEEEAAAHIKYQEDLRKEWERKRAEIEQIRQDRNARKKGERYRYDSEDLKQFMSESKLKRIIRRVLIEGPGDGLSDPQVEEAYYELQNMSRDDFAVDTDLSFLDEWPYSEARDILADEEAEEYDEFQGRGMRESIRRTLKEHLHGYKGSYKEPYMVREIPPEAKQLEWFGEWKEEFDLTKEAIEGNYRKMTNLSIDYPKMDTRNVDEDAMDLKHYHQMTATEKYVYNKNELMYLWEDLKRLWKELDDELGIEDGFASFGLGDKLF